MNSKHIALVIVALMGFGLIQATLWMRDKRDSMQKAVDAKAAEEESKIQLVNMEQSQVSTLTRASAGLLEFLQTWKPYFESLNSAQSAEVAFTMRVKEGNLVSLSQRFEQVANKDNASIPKSLRAYVTFEDNFSGLLNWLGHVEVDFPTVRIDQLRLSRGTRAGDLRMELTMDQPLLNP